MDETSIIQFITDSFDGVDVLVASRESGAPEVAWGDTFFYYNPAREQPPDHRFPFATIVTKDYGDFDCASNLNRPGIFRLNIGVSKETFRTLFGMADTGCDFTALDQLMPHPVYGAMYWVGVLNPSAATFQKVQPLLAEAYQLAVDKKTR